MKNTVAALLTLFAFPAFAGEFCEDLGPERVKGVIALAPIKCESLTPDKCNALAQKVMACLKRSRNRVVDEAAVKAAMSELELKAAQGGGDTTKDMAELVGGLGARFVTIVELGAEATVAMVRLVALEEGNVLSAARISLAEAGAKDGPVSYATVDEGLSQLADRLAGALAKIGGSTKKRRIAIMKFSETGDIATKNGMGNLASAELVTRFRRDHDMLVVERTRLDQVLKEFELGQLGVIDPKNAPKLGKMVDAEAIVLGSVADAGAEIKVYGQLVDVSTGVTLAADSVSLKAAGMITLASDAVVLRTKSGAVFRSLLVPGWGQMYNRENVKGGVILGLVLTLGGGAVAMQVVNMFATADYNKAGPGANFDSLAQRAETFAIARTALLGAMGVVWIYNIIDAYANGVTFDTATGTSVGGNSASSVQFGGTGISGKF